MIHAKQHNVVCKYIPQTDINPDTKIITLNESHPYYVEVVGVGSKVNDIEVGEYVTFVGNPVEHRVGEHTYLIVTDSQIKFSVDKEDL